MKGIFLKEEVKKDIIGEIDKFNYESIDTTNKEALLKREVVRDIIDFFGEEIISPESFKKFFSDVCDKFTVYHENLSKISGKAWQNNQGEYMEYGFDTCIETYIMGDVTLKSMNNYRKNKNIMNFMHLILDTVRGIMCKEKYAFEAARYSPEVNSSRAKI